MLHGARPPGAAAETARRTFEEGEAADTLPTRDRAGGRAGGAACRSFRLFVLAGLAASNGEARRLIRGGGARLNDAAVTDEGQLVPRRHCGTA